MKNVPQNLTVDVSKIPAGIRTFVTNLQAVYQRIALAINQPDEIAFVQGPRVILGSGSPLGVVSAPPGSVYLNTAGGAGTSFYVKEVGTNNLGWVGK